MVKQISFIKKILSNLFLKTVVFLSLISLMFFLFLLLPSTLLAAGEGGSGSWTKPFSSPFGSAQFREKVAKKEGSRWTLSEWMAQKDSNRMMDLWLGMYAPSPYEGFIGLNYSDYKMELDPSSGGSGSSSLSSEERFQSYSGNLGFYVLILGLEVQYENNWRQKTQETSSLINLRIAGNASQGTHLILNFGHRNKKNLNDDQSFEQNFAGVDLDIYIERHSGIHGHYRNYIPKSDSFWGETSGNYSEAGLFFDIGFLRCYGNAYTDVFSFTQTPLNQVFYNQGASSSTSLRKMGLNTGIKIFF